MKLSRTEFLNPIMLSDVGDTAGNKKRLQLLKTGNFEHARVGKFKITPEDLVAFKANFDRKVLGVDVQANFDHGESIAHGTKAAGWIAELTIEAEGKELWASVEWTDDALKGIKAKEWRYSSAEILFTWKHPETGATHNRVLTGLALTNQPFIKGMQPIAASEKQNKGKDEPMKLNEIEGLLLSEHAINLADLRAKAARVGDLDAQVVKLNSDLSAANGQVKDLGTKNAELTAKVELVEKEATAAKFSALVERGMKEGRVTKAFCDGTLKAICDAKGIEFAEKMVSDMPVNPALAGQAVGSNGEGAAADTTKFKTPDAEVVFKAGELRKADGKLSLSDAMSKVLEADPKLAKRYEEYQPALVETGSAD